MYLFTHHLSLSDLVDRPATVLDAFYLLRRSLKRVWLRFLRVLRRVWLDSSEFSFVLKRCRLRFDCVSIFNQVCLLSLAMDSLWVLCQDREVSHPSREHFRSNKLTWDRRAKRMIAKHSFELQRCCRKDVRLDQVMFCRHFLWGLSRWSRKPQAGQ